MKKIFLYALIVVFVLLLVPVSGECETHPVKKVAVMTDTGHRNGTNYLICGAAADIIATDIINRINETGRMKAPLLGETMSKITQQNMPLFYMTMLNDYKYNYNIDFVNLKRVTKNIQADYILMVTSGMDVQSQFLKDTWWNKLNIPGMDPVRPTYKLSTLITLIDKRTYNIVWQDLYLRDIEAHNYDLGIVQFSPSYAQLSKIKKYSKNMSEYVTNIVDRQVNPWIVPPEEPKAIEVKSRFVNEGTKIYYPTVNGEVVKENYNEFKAKKQKDWQNFKEKRQQKSNIQNINNTYTTKTVPQTDSVQLQPLNNVQSQNNGIIRQFQENMKLKQKQKQEEKLEKTRYKQYLQEQEEQQNYIQQQRKDKKLFDSIKNNLDDFSNTLPEPADTQEKYIVPVSELQVPKNEETVNNQNEQVEVIKLKPKELKPEMYKKLNETVK